MAAFQGFADQAVRRLTLLASAEALSDLAALPGNRLGVVAGRPGWTVQHSDQRKNGMRPVHPGEILREEIDAAGVSEGALSKALDVPLNRVTMILEGRQGITADTALRIARYFGTTPELWLNLQKTWGTAACPNRGWSQDRRARDAPADGGVGSYMAPDFPSLQLAPE